MHPSCQAKRSRFSTGEYCHSTGEGGLQEVERGWSSSVVARGFGDFKQSRESSEKKGKKKEEAKTVRGNYFSIAKDWEMSTDLENCLKIPKEVTFTNLRPDIILISRSTKQFGMVELTVPSEERVEVSGELKRLKYEEIAQDARLNGWGVRVWAVEVGCRGFPASSMASFLREIGYQGAQKKKTLEVIGKEAENASHSLWKASFFEKWGNK